MSILTNGGRIQLQEYAPNMGTAGKNFDSVALAQFFNVDQPHKFGLMVSQLFTASSKFRYKALTDMTEASGNYTEIDGSTYEWSVNGDDYRLNRVVKFLETGNSRIGENGAEFKIGLAEGIYEEPAVLCGENTEYPCEVIGKPINRGNYFEYTLRLQTSNPNTYIPAEELYEGREWRRTSSSIATEANQLFAGIEWGSQIDLRSQVGAFSGEFSVSDKVIRMQKAAKAKGQLKKEGSLFGGYSFPIYDAKTGNRLEMSGFISFAEAKLMDSVEMDCEWAMTFGKASQRKDYTGRYIKRTAPGFRELVKDGHEWYHNGSITLDQISDYLMSIFLTRVDENDREITIKTGTLGHRIIDQLISEEVSQFLTLDRYYVQPMQGGTGANDLQYGFQFKRFISKNGVVVNLQSDPMLDDPFISPRRYPNNPMYSLDSARMDILDFGSNSNSIAPNSSNISMIKEKGVDSYYVVGGVVHPDSGVVTDGSFNQNGMKEVYFRREKSGSLNVWDTGRIGSIILEPNL